MKLVTRAQMNAVDMAASTKYAIPSILLMEHAAHEVFLQIEKNWNKDTTFVFVCGSGNNGGDGFALARLMHLKGYTCAIHFIGNKERLTKDAKINYDTCVALNVTFIEENDYTSFDVIVDCIFGTGLCRDIEGKYKAIIESINALNKYVISIDIPSGIDSDSAKVLGVAIQANITYTMQAGKIGLYVCPGRNYAGKVVVLDIFIPQILVDETPSNTYLIQKDEIKAWLPARKVQSNKGSYGKVLCIGGSEGMSGAITMAAKSALSAGCGLLTCAIPKSIYASLMQHLLETMCLLLDEKDGHIASASIDLLVEKISNYTCALIGCGIGRSEDISFILEKLLAKDVPLIIDADGLHAFKKHMYNRKNTILTPHLKEFADLIDVSIKDVVDNTLYYVDAFTKMHPDITLVLKSETTIIAQNDVRYINTYGNNGLATGGSGDVLAGLITGLYAQNKDCLKAAVVGVFLHAFSADVLASKKSVYSIVPSDIITCVEEVLFKLSEGSL